LLVEVDSDSNSGDSCKDVSSLCGNQALLGGMSDVKKKPDDEGASLEKEDKIKVNAVRTHFYALNEKFEQLLKFKPIRKLHL
jgi:hypothetical protein